MLSAVKAIGEYIDRTSNDGEESRFVESSKLKNIKNVLCINFNFNEENGNATYSGIFFEVFDSSISTKYLYREFIHKRCEVTPTSKLPTAVNTENMKKLKNRFKYWFEQYCNKYFDSVNQKDAQLLKALENTFLREIDLIFSEIDERVKTLNKKELQSSIITITLNSKPLGDYKIFKHILKNEVCIGFYTKHDIESKGKSKCFLCGIEKEVLGFASPFPVYTLEKKGFAPNFIREDSWKRLPICKDCAILAIRGREFVEEYLLKRFYGIKFYVIPSFALRFDDTAFSHIVTPKKNYFAIVGNEDDVSEIMLSKFDQATLTFVFTIPEKGTFRIIGYVEDVPPSYMLKIKQTIEKLIYSHEQHESIFDERLLKIIYSDNNFVGDFRVNDTSLGGLFRPFFPQSEKESGTFDGGVFDKYFVGLVSDVLAQREIREDFLIKAYIRALRTSFIQNRVNKTTKQVALKSLMLTLLTSKLNILKHRCEVQFMSSSENGQFDDFFNQYETAFDTSSKRAVFLEGVLVKFLLDRQFANRKSSPFADKLYGLRIDERRAKKLYPEIIEKLREYKVTYTLLETAMTKALLEAENKGWNLTADEVSYFFTLGLVLAPIFKEQESKTEQESE